MLPGVNKTEAPGNNRLQDQDDEEMENFPKYEDYKNWDTDLSPYDRYDQSEIFRRSSDTINAIETAVNILIPCVIILVILIIILSVIIRLWKRQIFTCCLNDPNLIDEDSLGICTSSDEDSFTRDEDADVLPSVSAVTTLQRKDYTNIDSEGSPESCGGRNHHHTGTHTLNASANQSDSFNAHDQADVESSNESFPSGAGGHISPCEQLVVVEEDFLNVDHYHEESIL